MICSFPINYFYEIRRPFGSVFAVNSSNYFPIYGCSGKQHIVTVARNTFYNSYLHVISKYRFAEILVSGVAIRGVSVALACHTECNNTHFCKCFEFVHATNMSNMTLPRVAHLRSSIANPAIAISTHQLVASGFVILPTVADLRSASRQLVSTVKLLLSTRCLCRCPISLRLRSFRAFGYEYESAPLRARAPTAQDAP